MGELLGVKVRALTGETRQDLKLLNEGQVVVATTTQWDALSRSWKQRRVIQTVTLFIMDEIHLLGGADGPTMEVVMSRMRYLSTHLNNTQDSNKQSMRIIGLGSPIANAKEVGDWIGVTNASKSLFAFSPKVRPVPLEIFIQSFDTQSFSSRLMAMSKPVYNAIKQHTDYNKPAIVFVPSRRQAQLTAIDLITYGETLGSYFPNQCSMFLKDESMISVLAKQSEYLKEPALQQVVNSGVGFLYKGMIQSDLELVMELYRSQKLRVIVSTFDLCWRLNLTAHLIVIMGTEYFDGREGRHVDYPVSDLLQMMGRACRPGLDVNGKCVLFCHTPKKKIT